MDNEKKIEIPFGAFDSELIRQEISIPNGFNAVIEGDKIILTRAESEDERVRKALVKAVSGTLKGTKLFGTNVTRDEALAWLEKQGETYTKRDVDNAYLEGMAFAKEELDKQGEQKPAWSEEDEERLSDAIFFVREYQIPTRDKRLLNAAKEAEDWLKSLIPQNRWKPNDEQMADLWNMLCECRPADHQLLQDIYYGLKKLREE